MSTSLPPPIEAYFAAKAADEIDSMIAPFSEAAIVKDEGEEMRGLTAIRKWMEETIKKYQYKIEITGVAERTVKTTVRCRLTGSFPGSPVDVSYVFVLDDGKIAGLDIS